MSTNDQQIAVIARLFGAAEARGMPLWLESGWAIDARLGLITRPHEDVDIAFPAEQAAAYRQLLTDLGCTNYEELDYGFLCWCDGVLLDSEPCVWNGQEYTFAGFPAGSCPAEQHALPGAPGLRCLSWAAMYTEFLGYMDEVPRSEWRAKDHASLSAIESHLSEQERQALVALYNAGESASRMD